MSDDQIKSALKNAITETLENLAFIQLIEIEGPRLSDLGPDFLQDMLSVYLPMKHEYGILVMSASGGILKETACNIFALDPGAEPGEDIIKDTLAEILNTVSGQFMRLITPGDQFYELGLPVIGAFNLNGSSGEEVKCAFETESGDRLLISYIKISDSSNQ